MALALIVNFSVAESNLEAAKQLVRRMQEHTRREPGCLEYQCHQSRDDPSRFLFYELYRDEAALDAHRASPHYDQFITRALLAMMETRVTGLFDTVD